MNRLFRFPPSSFLFAVSLAVLPAAASAQQPSQAQISAIKQSCRSDYMSVCSDVPTGGSAALQCLQQHQASVSQGCRNALASVSGGSEGNGMAGAGARPPGGESSGGMSSGGMTAMAPPPRPAMSPRQELALMRNACGGDFRAYCRGVALGGGRALNCLAANEQRLSPACKAGLAEARGGR